MRHIIETGTDGATLCCFDPAALPADFDQRLADDPVSAFEELQKEGRFWWHTTDGDGAYLFHFYMDAEVPEEIQKHSRDPLEMARFAVPSGTIWACGAEYAARDPQTGNANTPKGGLGKYSRMGGRFKLPPGDYGLTAWRIVWPDGMLEEQLRNCLSKAANRLNRLGTVLGVLFFGLMAVTVVAVVVSLAAVVAILTKGRSGLGISFLSRLWGVLLVLWAICWPLVRLTARMEQNPARREVEREFPSIVVRLRRIS